MWGLQGVLNSRTSLLITTLSLFLAAGPFSDLDTARRRLAVVWLTVHGVEAEQEETAGSVHFDNSDTHSCGTAIVDVAIWDSKSILRLYE